MDLAEEYLRAVALLLPKDQREDIVAELRDVILSRIEARETELGRRLSDDETEAVLREIGHPLVVSAGYRSGPQHLIGPALYPYWLFGVKVAVTIQAVIALVVFVVRTLTRGDVVRAFTQAFGSAVTGSLVLIGVATVIAWLIERRTVQVPYLDRWRVRDLRGLEFASWDMETLRDRFAPAGRAVAGSWASASVGRAGAAAGRGLGGLAWGVVLLMWWTDLLDFPVARDIGELREFGVDPGALAAVDWVALKAALFWPVAAYCGAVMIQGLILLLRPREVRLQGALDLAIGAAALGATAWIWSASPISAQVSVGTAAQFARRMHEAFGHGPPFPLAPLLTVALAASALGALGRMLRGLWELALGRPRLPAAEMSRTAGA